MQTAQFQAVPRQYMAYHLVSLMNWAYCLMLGNGPGLDGMIWSLLPVFKIENLDLRGLWFSWYGLV